MKVITRAVFQMTPAGFELLEEDSHEYSGEIAEAKGGGGSGSGGTTVDPATQAMLIRQSADLNRTNTAGTYGSSEWSIDPQTGRYTQNVSLDPSQQRQLDTRNGIAENMLGSAHGQLGAVSTPFSYSDSVSPTARAGFDAASARLAPDFEQQNRSFDQTQANRGIPIGSESYNKDQRTLQQGQNDQLTSAAEGAVNTGNQQDLSQRQQNYSDIANLLAAQNTQTPTAGTNAAVDTTGNFNTLNGNVGALRNAAASQQAQGTSALFSLLGAFL
jgi:hypothetical protein